MSGDLYPTLICVSRPREHENKINAYIRWVNADRCICAIHFTTLEPLDMDYIFFSVNTDDFCRIEVLSLASNNLYFITFADGHTPNFVLRSKLFRQRSAHKPPANVRRGVEVTFTGFTTWATNMLIKLHLLSVTLDSTNTRVELLTVQLPILCFIRLSNQYLEILWYDRGMCFLYHYVLNYFD